ncbi:MAG: ribosome maturation factor RimP [Parasporobacterium sp.]|nr:ribosome maturation factor RimP [Parasporobacterium sp.]
MTAQQIEKKTEELIMPIMEANSFWLVDTEFVKEGHDWYLRAYIDKEGGININDCELVSRALEEKLDAADFIEQAYILEVSSPGLDRPLKKPSDYERNLGKPVELHLYKAVNKIKDFVGELVSYSDDTVTISCEGEEMTFTKKEISMIRQYFEF